MKCPKHDVSLIEKNEDGITYKECPECGGVWMAYRQLRALAKNDSETSLFLTPLPHELVFKSDEDDTNDLTVCPLDGGNLFEHKFGGVKIDICSECNYVWFDPDELEIIKEYLAEDTLLETVIQKISKFIERIAA
jgi:Zn-finger nucleic acid-binding protein